MVVFNSEAADELGENRLQKSVITKRISPSIGAFTVQCAKCFKLRLIPTKEKYEEIRERIIQEPFVCKRAREWRPDVTCNDPEDISQDGSRLWAIDKPNIAQPPHGWERQIRIRVNPIAWAVPTKHEGDASEEASLADETLASEVVLTRKRKIGSSLSVEPNHLFDEFEPKFEDA
ncbi:Methyl-CpG-binding domain-containing protein 2 [Zea mays]|uniref:Methyl-CpG-binding domain-containing protein 2 n=1 Tax=Zea mays TaxID=4577 RepID=A0A3L6DSQ5_MAIZE|nr:Methyl-CpG-binding domain-containing protein 2 [Zea mays]